MFQEILIIKILIIIINTKHEKTRRNLEHDTNMIKSQNTLRHTRALVIKARKTRKHEIFENSQL